MADVTIRSEVVMKLTQEEFKLVGLGLAGKLKGRDVQSALKLNVRLLEQQEAFLADAVLRAAGALKAARTEIDEPVDQLLKPLTAPEGG